MTTLEDTIASKATNLTDHYPNAYSDFYGSNTPCIYKSGREWPMRMGPYPGIIREARPVTWTCIHPLAYANEGEGKPFCPLILSIGVVPNSLVYGDAVAAASGVKEILAQANFPDIEVAFVESVITHSVSGPKLLSFNTILDSALELRKPFTPTLEATPGRRSLHLVVGAVKTLEDEIRYQSTLIEIWNDVLHRLGEPVEGEDPKVTESRNEHLDLVAKAEKRIEKVDELRTEVTKHHTTPNQRIIGFVIHSEPIEVSVEPHCYTKDWALIELYNDKFDWSNFRGNKVYIGGNISTMDFGDLMFPHPTDQADYHRPKDGLLQAFGVVQDTEIRNPQHLDAHGEKCMFVVKNGLSTGTTFGRANGLGSFKRTYDEYGIINQTSIDIAILPYDKMHGSFSAAGDSGSIVLDRKGRILGTITGGSGATDRTDITSLTPTGGSRSRSRPSTPTLSSTRSSSRWESHSTSTVAG